MTTRQMNINIRTYYLYNEVINIKDFDARLLKLDKKTSMGLNIYYIGYITKKPEWNINSINPLYLMVNRIDGFIEEINGDKYLNINDTERNNEVLRKYSEVWDGIKNCIEKINDNKLGKYSKDFMKIKFNSDDNIPLNKELTFPTTTIIIRNIFEKDGKYYLKIFLMNVCMKYKQCFNMKELIFLKDLILIKQISQ